jgi:hypothetical protein
MLSSLGSRFSASEFITSKASSDWIHEPRDPETSRAFLGRRFYFFCLRYLRVLGMGWIEISEGFGRSIALEILLGEFFTLWGAFISWGLMCFEPCSIETSNSLDSIDTESLSP